MITLGLFDETMKNEFVRMLSDGDSSVRANALRMLTELGKYDSNVINSIINLVRTETEDWVLKKAMMFFVLNKFDVPQVKVFLIESLKNNSREAREYASLALSGLTINDAPSLSSLVTCLTYPVGAVRDNCRFALRVNSKSIPADLKLRIQGQFADDANYIFGK